MEIVKNKVNFWGDMMIAGNEKKAKRRKTPATAIHMKPLV
jgi:hypothetical protein